MKLGMRRVWVYIKRVEGDRGLVHVLLLFLVNGLDGEIIKKLRHIWSGETETK